MKLIQSIFKRLLLIMLLVSASLYAEENNGERGVLTGTAENISLKHIGSGVGGAMFAIAIDPTDTSNIFFSGDMGLVYHTSNGGKTWKIISGMYHIRFIKFDAKNPNIVWAGGGSGLYKSIDGGRNWKYSFDIGSRLAALGAMAIDPSDSNIIYVAEGFVPSLKISWARGKVYKSTDGGKTWNELNRPGGVKSMDAIYNRNYSTIVIDPNSSYVNGAGHSRVYLVGRDGIFKTENGGISWNNITFFDAGQGSDMVLLSKNGKSTIFSSVIPVKGHSKKGVYRSDDNGATWKENNNGLNSIVSRLETRNKDIRKISLFSLMLATSSSNPNKLYVGSWQGIAKSDNMGESWEQTTPAETTYIRHAQGKYVQIPHNKRPNHIESFFGGIDNFIKMRVSPSNSDFIIFSDNQDIHLSKDGGVTWKSITFDYTDRFVDSAKVIPTLPEDAPKNRYTHKIKSRGIQGTVNRDIAIDPFDSKIYYATYMDIGMQISRDRGETWEHPTNGLPPKGHAWSVMVDPLVEGRLWVSVGERGEIYQSNDKGLTWNNVSLGDTRSGRVSDMLLDPRSDKENRLLYASSEKKGIYRSNNGGRDWNNIFSEATFDIKLDRLNKDIIYAGTKRGLYKSTNKGATWSNISGSQMGKVYNITVGKEDRVYVISNAFGKSARWEKRKLWKSEDGGVTFSEITPLFMHYIGAVAVNPSNPDYLYIATFNTTQNDADKMIMARSINGGETWESIGEDFAFALGTDIYIDPKNEQHLFFNTRFSLIEAFDQNVENNTEDVEKPSITLIGNSIVSIQKGVSYVDAGVRAYDNVDGDITSKVVIKNPVNVSISGKYIITYNVTDKADNIANEVSREVIVYEKLKLETVYENGEDKKISRWSILGNNPDESTIRNIYDEIKQSNVIQFSGNQLDNEYIIGGEWNNRKEKVLYWSMNYNESFEVSVAIKTLKGDRILSYTEDDNDFGLRGINIHHGLGKSSVSGQWQTYIRNLDKDLKEFESDNSLVSVKSFSIKGSGRIDDVILKKYDESGRGILTGRAENISLKHIGSGVGGSMFAIAIDPTDTSNIFFSGDMGLVYHTSNGGKTWKIISGMYHIRFIKFDAKNPNIVWAGGGSGLYKSIDGGRNWKYSFDIGSRLAALGAMAIDPSDSNIIYVAEGFVPSLKISWARGKVYKSTDGGKTWNELNRPGGVKSMDAIYNRNYSTIVIDPNSSYVNGAGHSRVYLVGRDGIFKTENGGISWNNITFFDAGQGSDMVLLSKNGKSTIFSSVIPVKGHSKKGVYRSDDNGATWKENNNGLNSIVSRLETRNKDIRKISLFSLMLATSSSNPNKLYVGSWQGIAKSDNMGESWEQTTPAETTYIRHAQGKYVQIPHNKRPNHIESFFGGIDNFIKMRVSPSNSDFIIFSDNQDIHLSKDGGVTWKSITFDYTDRFVDSAKVIPTLPEDAPKNRYTHKIKSRGIQGTVNRDIAIDPFDSKIYYATYMDIGMQISRDRGETWEHPTNGLPPKGHAWSVMVDPLVEGRLWVSVGERGEIYQSNDKGLTWNNVSLGDTRSGRVSDMLLDPRSDKENRLLYASSEKKGIYRSNNGGRDWNNIFSEATFDIKLDRLNKDIIYAGTKRGLYKSTNKGATWSNISGSQMGKVYNITVGKEDRVYVISNAFGKSARWEKRKLWKSEDGGVTFSEITPLFMHYIGAVAVNPSNPDYLYIATFNTTQNDADKMIMARSINGGETWESIGEDFAFALGTDIYIDPKNEQHLFFNTRFSLIEAFDQNVNSSKLKANAGKDKILKLSSSNRAVYLDGSKSTPSGSIVSYKWYDGDKYIGSSKSRWYTLTTKGKHTITLKVVDKTGKKSEDNVIITVINGADLPPNPNDLKANAGEDKILKVTPSNRAVHLDGSKSTPSDSIVSYKWYDGDKYIGSSKSRWYTLFKQGIHTISLEVINKKGIKSTDTMTVTVINKI